MTTPGATTMIRRRLAAALAEVDVRLARVPPPAPEGHQGDAADRVIASQEHDGIVWDYARLQTRRRLLLAALTRLAQRRYGICLDCQQLIGVARLAAVPEVEHCLICQDRRERAAAEANETSHPSRRTP